MPVLDLKTNNSKALGTLAKYSAKADSTDDEHFSYDLTLSFPVKTVEDADIAGKLIPGAREIFERSNAPDNNEKFNQVVNPTVEGLKLWVSSKSGPGISGGAEVLEVRMRGSKRSVVVNLKVRMGGQAGEVAGRLTHLLRNAAEVSTELAQQPLNFPKSAGPAPSEGNIVTFQLEDETTVVGRLIETTDDGLVINDFGTEHIIQPQEVLSFFGVEGKGKTLTDLLKSYKSRCGRRGVEQSWGAISGALLAEFAAGPEHFNGKLHAISIDTIAAAVKRLEGVMPSEAGGDGGSEAAGQA